MNRSASRYVLAVALIAPALLTAQQRFDDASIAAAIKAGQANKFDQYVSTCGATAGFGEGMAAALSGGVHFDGSFDVTAANNAGHIAVLAAYAKRLYKPFAISDVTDAMRIPAIFVTVTPAKPTAPNNAGSISVGAPIERVILKTKAAEPVVLQPLTFQTEPVEWSNLMGGKVESNRATATFDLDGFRDLKGDVDVTIITTAGERRCKIGPKDRAKLIASH